MMTDLVGNRQKAEDVIRAMAHELAAEAISVSIDDTREGVVELWWLSNAPGDGGQLAQADSVNEAFELARKQAGWE
jgi:hypothetical protein